MFKANASTEGAVVKRFIGGASTYVLACNPTKEQRNQILGADIESEPNYVGTREIDGKEVTNIQVTFYVKPDVEDAVVIPMTFFVTKNYRWNKDHTKVQVIDKYGYSGWATKEQCESHAQLLSSAGKKLRITTAYRPAFEGEIALVEFIKNYLNIDEAIAYVEGEWKQNTKVNLADCECSLDMDALFKGKFDEVQTVPTLIPTNKVKVAFGVRTNDEGKQYQVAYTNVTMKNGARGFDAIQKDIDNRKANGGLSTTEIDTNPFREYTVEATSFEQPAAPVNDPFASNNTEQLPWD